MKNNNSMIRRAFITSLAALQFGVGPLNAVYDAYAQGPANSPAAGDTAAVKKEEVKFGPSILSGLIKRDLKDSTTASADTVDADTVEIERDFIESENPTHNTYATQVLLQPSVYDLHITPNRVNDLDSLFYTARGALGARVRLRVQPAQRTLNNLSEYERRELGNRRNIQKLYRTLKQEAAKYPADSSDVARLNAAGADMIFNPGLDSLGVDSSLVNLINEGFEGIVGFNFYTQARVAGKDTIPGESVPAIVHVKTSRNDAVKLDNLSALMGSGNDVAVPDTVYMDLLHSDTLYVDNNRTLKAVGLYAGIAVAAALVGYAIKKIVGGGKGHGGSSHAPGLE